MCGECDYCLPPIPGHWIPAIPAGMTGMWFFVFLHQALDKSVIGLK